MSLMGIDVGTSGCKVVALSLDGRVLHTEHGEYPIISAGPEMYELNPEEVWTETVKCIQRCNHSPSVIQDPVTSLSISAQGEAIVPVSRNCSVLANAPISADMRGKTCAEAVKEKYGLRYLYDLTGQIADPIHSVFKLLWWRDNRNELCRMTWKFLCCDSFFHLRLGVAPSTDGTMASRTMLYDVGRRKWSDTLLKEVGIDASQLALVRESGKKVGHIEAGVGAELGFCGPVSVVSGGHDQSCAALGSGVTADGVCYTLGTTECLSWVSPKHHDNLSVSIPTYPHVAPDSFVSLIGSQTGGRLFSWVIGLLSGCGASENFHTADCFYRYIQTVPPDYTTETIVMPHLAGTGMYFNNPNAKGFVAGLTLQTSAKDILKGILEGITFEQYLTFSHLPDIDMLFPKDNPINAVGGGCRLENWLQIKADIFGRKINKMRHLDASCLGAAMLAGIGAGEFVSLKEAVERCVTVEKSFEPNHSMTDYYSQKIRDYESLYRTMNAHKGLTV